ncbi:MAG: hypothetical protein JXR37_32675 [Kiritimatiellae bacterium]|nr:hypothetical protein [Kiritimatiellia bacterium]
MKDEQLRKSVLDAAFDENGRRKLTCAEAFRIAAEHGVKKTAVMRVCNAEGIRICRCQLGCFK